MQLLVECVIDDRVNERSVSEVSPLLPRQLLHRLFCEVSANITAANKRLHLAGDECSVMTKHFDAFERKTTN